MNFTLENIKYKFNTGNIVIKVIYLTTAVFVLTFLMNTFSFLIGNESNFVIDWFALYPNFDNLLTKPWSIITYGFLHADIFHILFNLLILFYFGNVFLDFFTEKDFIKYFLLGIVVGGFIYLLSYSYLPGLQSKNSVLVGASAGVTAIVIGLATLIPNYAFHFMFIGRVQLKWIALAMILLDLIQIPNGNAGGHLAHLGGALIGFLLTSNRSNLKAPNKKFSNIFSSPSKKNQPFKKVYKSKTKPKYKQRVTTEEQEQINTILDKISKSGYETLSKEEKDFLFKVGKK